MLRISCLRQPVRGMPAMPTRMRGMSLIEVMVSVLILGIGLLGIAAMQSMALRAGQSSLESSQAVMQTTGIIEAMRANSANASSYNTAKTCTAPAGATLAANDLGNWVTTMQGSLGTSACGEISGCPAACVITVYWDDTRSGGAAARTRVTRAQI
jgi:type IV pilus assembly protein PilV